MTTPRDEWKETWDWAEATWGTGPGFTSFFRCLARRRAEAEGWEELGTSDVWHATFDAVKRAKEQGAATRAELEEKGRAHMGMY
jgi:hypothetical protein